MTEVKENVDSTTVKKEDEEVEKMDEGVHVENKENGDHAEDEDVEGEPKGFEITDYYKNAKNIDIGRCMVIRGLPTGSLNDSYEIFCDMIISMLADDFGVTRESVESIVRLAKDEERKEGYACQAMLSFKSRVHKHRVFAVKSRAESILALEHVETIPHEVVEMIGEGMDEDEIVEEEKEGEDETLDEEKKEDGEKKEGEENEDKKNEKKERQPFRDEHSERPFTLCWDGAPEFQWKLMDVPTDSKKLVIENADPMDLLEPFLYRTALKADQVLTKMPGRVIDDQPTANHFGTITFTFAAEHLVMQQAMLNLIYMRTNGNRRLKIYLPQTKQNLHRKKEFEGRLGRKIEYPESFYELILKADDISLSESEFGVEEAKAAFPRRKIESVTRVEDGNQKVCFVVKLSSAEECVLAHAYHKTVKIGEITCRVYMVAAETASGGDRQDKYLTRLEKIVISKERTERKRKEREDAIAKGEAPAKKARIGPPPRKVGRLSTGSAGSVSSRGGRGRGGGGAPKGMGGRGGMPVGGNKDKGPAFKSPNGPARGNGAGYSRSAFARDDQRTPQNRGGRMERGGRPERVANNVGGGGGAWRAPPSIRDVPFKSPERRNIDEMVREQRRQLEMQEQLIRQQQVISAMAERLRDSDRAPGLSSSAFRDPTPLMGSSAFDRSSSYLTPSAASYNKASSYTPSPAYEPLSSSYTPSHLSNPAPRPFDDLSRSAPYPSSSSYGKPSSYSNASSSYQRDRRY